MTRLDYRLNAIVDAALRDIAPLPELALKAARSGATIIQYRDKTATTRAMIDEAESIVAVLRGTGVPLVINDRVDVALASKAQGVHLGADDMEPGMARALLGAGAVIGMTIKTVADAEQALTAPIDYGCIGGVFQTASKVNPDPPVGLTGLAQLRQRIRHSRPDLPVGAIAGITLSQVPSVITAGADGIALISALFRSGEIEAATERFRSAIDEALELRP